VRHGGLTGRPVFPAGRGSHLYCRITGWVSARQFDDRPSSQWLEQRASVPVLGRTATIEAHLFASRVGYRKVDLY
jgi:hypothetical protein